MNSLDLGILTIASLFFVRGLFRGFINELVTVVGLVLGYIISITYLGIVVSFLQSFFPSAPVSVLNIAGFFALFVGTNLILRLMAQILTKTLKVAMLGWLNRLLGGVFGLLKGVILMSAIVLVINLVPFSSVYIDQWGGQESLLFPLLNMLGPRLYEEIQSVTGILI
ncbi:MAG: CvpA family protein [Calditrichales bacterium]|nr:MAG: CvpA family protein [Calditrichales bacterium]